MTKERLLNKDIPTTHKSLYALYRVAAIKQVAAEMDVRVKTIAPAGGKYSDKIVPDEMEYIELDTGQRRDEFWEKVDLIAPPPTPDDIKSGKYPR